MTYDVFMFYQGRKKTSDFYIRRLCVMLKDWIVSLRVADEEIKSHREYSVSQ